MSGVVFSTEQTIALDAIGAGATITQAAVQAGVHRNTISNWRRTNSGFQVALSSAQYDGALLKRERMVDLFEPALAAIRGILTDPKASPSARVKAALAIVNLATSPIALPETHPVQFEEAAGTPKNEVHNSAQFAQSEPPQPAPAPVETVRRDHPAIGRNEPCPCGSRLKFKRCCLNKPKSASNHSPVQNAQMRDEQPGQHPAASGQTPEPLPRAMPQSKFPHEFRVDLH
jgi:hypothetical protein